MAALEVRTVMSVLEVLEQEVFDAGVGLVDSRHLPSWDRDLDGMYASEGDQAVIAVSSDLAAVRRTEALAHEWGHHRGGAAWPGADAITSAKYEEKANRIAYRRMIPIEALKEALREGCLDWWNLGHRFDVSAEFAQRAVEMYQATGELNGFGKGS